MTAERVGETGETAQRLPRHSSTKEVEVGVAGERCAVFPISTLLRIDGTARESETE